MGGRLGLHRLQPGPELIQPRPGITLSPLTPFIRRLVFNFSLQFIQFPDTFQRLFRYRTLARFVLVKEFAAGVGPATRFGDIRPGMQRVVTGIIIRHQRAARPVFQQALGITATAAGMQLIVHHCRRDIGASNILSTDRRAGSGLFPAPVSATGSHRHAAPGTPAASASGHRPAVAASQPPAPPCPTGCCGPGLRRCGHRFAVDGRAAGGHDIWRPPPEPATPALECPFQSVGLGFGMNSLAGRTAVLRTDITPDDKRGRTVFQPLTDFIAQKAQGMTAIRAALRLRRQPDIFSG